MAASVASSESYADRASGRYGFEWRAWWYPDNASAAGTTYGRRDLVLEVCATLNSDQVWVPLVSGGVTTPGQLTTARTPFFVANAGTSSLTVRLATGSLYGPVDLTQYANLGPQVFSNVNARAVTGSSRPGSLPGFEIVDNPWTSPVS